MTSTDGADLPEQLRRLGEFIVRGQGRNEARFDRLETDMATVKSDVAELKTDVAELKDWVQDIDLAMNNGFARIEAKLESWSPHIVAKEEKQTPPKK